MKEIKGKFSSAKIFTDDVEDKAVEQVQALLDSPVTENCRVVVMPDVHAGKGSTIGYTQTIQNRIIPNAIGVDIGCGMSVLIIKKESGDKLFGTKKGLKYLDKIAREKIPMGNRIRNTVHELCDEVEMNQLNSLIADVNTERAMHSIGSLGSGNHFIELDKDTHGNYYLIIHTGSRHLGVEVCNYWQKKAEAYIQSGARNFKEESAYIIAKLKETGREVDIQKELNALKQSFSQKGMNNDIAYLEGEDLEGYLHDMRIAQEFASLNRKAIQEDIKNAFGLKDEDIIKSFSTIHNYIDLDRRIIRKGAIRLEQNEIAIIPGSMAYGALIVEGKGNSGWNYSGPHGFGRKHSRTKAKELFSMDEFKKSMEGVYTSSISKSTLDESPMAYKDPDSIIPNLKDTCTIIEHIIPVWNIKAGD